MKKTAWIAPAALLLVALPPVHAQSAGAASMGPTLDRIARTQVIRLGYRDSSSPFSYIPQGKSEPIGYGTDVCMQVVAGIKRDLRLPDLKIKWVHATASERFEQIKKREIDIECANTTVTPERRTMADFATPYFIAGTAVLAASNTGAKTLADLAGKTVVIAHNSSGEKLFKQIQARYDLKALYAEAGSESMAALEQGKAQAYIDDDIALAQLRAEAPNPEKYTLLEWRHTRELLALMFPKDEPQLTALVDRHVNDLIISGEIQKIYDRWFMQPIAPKNTNLKIPMSRYLRDIFLSTGMR